MNDPVALELRTTLDGPWAAVRGDFREQIEPSMLLGTPGESMQAQRERVTDQVLQIASIGHGRVGFPQAYGGTYDYGASCALFEMQGYGDLSLLVKLGVQFGLFGGAVSRLGTQRHHEEYLRGIMDAQIMGSFAMTEIGHGSNVQRLETTITYDPATDELVVNSPTPSSVKTYIGNAAKDARMAVVFGQLLTPEGEFGVHAVLMEVRDAEGNVLPGITIEDNGVKGGLPGVDNGTFAFADVRIPRSALLNKFADIDDEGRYQSDIANENARFFTMLGTLVRGRVCVGGGAASAAKKGLAIALRYGARRRQFEAPGAEQEIVVLDYLAHQRKLFPRLAKSYALSFAQNAITETLQELHGTPLPDGETHPKEAIRELETRAAGLKAVSTWHAVDTLQACREACGGAGFIAENQLTQARADVDVFATFEGDNTVLLQLVAKGLLTEYKEMFGDLAMAELAGLVTKQVAEGLVERTTGRAGLQRLRDLAKGRDHESAMDDTGWLLSMFEQRADHALETVGKRLRKAGKDNGFELFNSAQDHVLFAARTHIDRCILEAALEAHDDMADGEAKELMRKVLALYALSSIEEDKAWFLEHGRLNSVRSRQVTASINDLCRELRPRVHTLVDGMGIPESLITAPIATGEHTTTFA
ncbi:acyl-CoA dehydrogenase [Yimella sp. cx-51]|uniref:acyl-CoA dehydrogenase family protein n=1 Tax=Yimella sp. cx-51 TaxID=2770551 RepID=UPI00165EBB67|nr:acyl-CoA dehydrogenase [Yimella sp. cx-51]MBC9955853.1 acyl-CoA dehydrogenase family protein [Yimella sp. cx-51]QTH37601.1 acyl-CoA dehydrogenase family protein [Yimella sp. cx-51]